jgi:signal transduction histidine kinase
LPDGREELDRAEVADLVSAQMAEAERRRRSARVNLLVSGFAAAFALLCIAPSSVLNHLGWRGAAVVGFGWLIFELACAAFRLAGYDSRIFRGLLIVEELAKPGVVFGLIYLSNGYKPSLLFIAMMLPFAWFAQTRSRMWRSAALRAFVCTVVAVAFFARGQVAQGAITVELLLIGIAQQRSTTDTLLREVEMSAERDVLERAKRLRSVELERKRISRELHDGLGADVMALLIKHRSMAAEDPVARASAARAQEILEDLRQFVRTLRGDQAG